MNDGNKDLRERTKTGPAFGLFSWKRRHDENEDFFDGSFRPFSQWL